MASSAGQSRHPLTEIALIRHGETNWNREGRIQGHLDIPLNVTGERQAASLCNAQLPAPADAVYSSDLERAYRTALPLVPDGPSAIRRDSRLRERNLGVLQGLTREEAMARQPEGWRVFSTRDPEAPLEGGESLVDFYGRVTTVLIELSQRHAGKRIHVVTHGGVLDAARRFVNSMPLDRPRDFPIRNASINVLVHDTEQWSIASWGEVGHLGAGRF